MKPWWKRHEFNDLWFLIALVVSLAGLFILALIGTGRAEILADPVTVSGKPQPHVDIKCSNFDSDDPAAESAACYRHIEQHVPYFRCRATMEAAMKVMDEFTYFGGIITTDAVYRSPQAELHREIDRLNRRDAAKAQWDQAKAECWGKP